MEPGVKAYLIRILNTIALSGLCLMLNIILGIKYEWAFMDTGFHWQNLLFYFFMLISIAALVWYLIRLWREPLDLEN